MECADEDQAQAIGPGRFDRRDIGRFGRICAKLAFGQTLEKMLPLVVFRLEIAKYVFDQNHRGIDDDAEIDSPNR